MLPTFLGIGAPKAGTSWLHDVLDSHPQIWMARRREVHYFDRHYDRGEDWYRRLFPDDREGDRYRAVGEITPHYLYHDLGPERIAAVPSVRGLIVLLRNPVDRAYSHYWFRVRIENYRGSFEQFLEQCPEATDWGLYARHLSRYTERFPRDRFLVLLYERLFDPLEDTLRALAGFLGVDGDAFPGEVARRRVNPRFVPRFRRTYAAAFGMARWLVRRDFYGAVKWIKDRRVMRLLRGEAGDAMHDPMNPETRERLRESFSDDIRKLETMFDIDLSPWTEPDSEAHAPAVGTPLGRVEPER